MACIYLLNSCGGPGSFDFDITYFVSNYSYPLLVVQISQRGRKELALYRQCQEKTQSQDIIYFSLEASCEAAWAFGA